MIAVVSCHHYADDERIYHRQLKAMILEKYKIQYFTRSEYALEDADDFTLYKNYLPDNYSVEFYQKAVFKVLEKNPPNILHIHEPELLWLAKKAKEKFGSIIFYDVHEDYPSLISTFSRLPKSLHWIKKQIWIHREKKYLPWVDEIILASPAIINSQYKDQGFNPRVFNNFPETDLFPNMELNFDREPILVYHGHLAPERGISELIEAMALVVRTIPHVILNLFGTFRTKNYESKVLNRIKSLGLEKIILWHGQVPHRDMWSHLVKAKVGLIPFNRNALTEIGTPTKLFEYMASGCRIVASDLPPLKQFRIGGLHLFNPGEIQQLGDEIINALNNTSHQDLHANRNIIYDKYNWGAQIKGFISMYQDHLK